MHKDFDLQVEHTRHKCAIYEWMGVVMITENTFPSSSSLLSSSSPFSNPITQINTQTNTTHTRRGREGEGEGGGRVCAVRALKSMPLVSS